MMNRILSTFLAVIGASLFLCCDKSCSQELKLANLSYSMRDSNVVVHYDLGGPLGKQYKVLLTLRRESQPFFKMTPKTVTGDIGSVSSAGNNHEVVWNLFEDVPYGLDGDDYYFEVTATLLGVEKGGTSWLYYAGGALVAGTAAVYFGTDLFKKTGGASQFPVPPSRP